MTNEELIAALEAAVGPSRELDECIALAVGWTRMPDQPWKWLSPDRSVIECFPPRAYTSSLDAALMLVPEGRRIWRMAQPDRCGEWKACAISDCDYIEGQHVELPYALCIAALRARSAQP